MSPLPEPGRQPMSPLSALAALATVAAGWGAIHCATARAAPVGGADGELYFRLALGGALPGGTTWRALTAPALHGDLGHLASNCLELLVLGGLLAATGFGVRRTLALLAATAPLGPALALWSGSPTLGASTGLFALGGALLLLAPGRGVRMVALAWLALGLLGGAVAGGIDQRAHLAGAVAGIILAPALQGLPADALRALGLGAGLLLALGPAIVSRRIAPAREATLAATPELAALEACKATLGAWIEWNGERHLAIGRVIDAGRTGEPGPELVAAMQAALAPPPRVELMRATARRALHRLTGAGSRPSRRVVAAAAERAFEALEAARPDPGFTGAMRESDRPGWKHLMGEIEAESVRLEEAGRSTGALGAAVFAAAAG